MGTSKLSRWVERVTGGRHGHPAATTPGAAAEARAAEHLQRQGLQLLERNYRVARGPSARGGEVDLIMRDADGTLVFVEVRSRHSDAYGSAAATVTARKQSRIVLAARHYLLRLGDSPPCRFDVVAIDGDSLTWLPGAFDAG